MKHISQIDNVDNLRALVRHELRELGIKVPKLKKSKRGANKAQECTKSTLFGSYLAHAHCVHIPDCGYVAKFLVDAAEIVKANINCEGIFRKSGAVSRQKEIKQQLENGTGFKEASVHDVTAIVKQFFRELPEPLLTSTYHNTFIQCYQMEDEGTSIRALLLLCLLLPGEHISTLRFIMLLLAGVAADAENNKMDATNLAVVLAPNIMHVNSKTVTMKSCEEKLLQVQTCVVEQLIKHADEVGLVDDMLVEKTAFMSEVFSTDDELDASEDNLEDSKDNRKKEKKRKRSGSFQGFVSSIAQSITKWRRSTDGKTNTSSISQGSNVSQMSTASEKRAVDKVEESSDSQANIFKFSASDMTPVVRRKKAPQKSEGRAFSANKKKAILQQLPQQSALGSTPLITPASHMKRMDINSVRRAGALDTPSMPPRPYQCTPRISMKTPRKKLTLFSPASTTKKKRYSSSTNLSVQSASKKNSKKGIFRRLSGSKGDQILAGPTAEAGNRKQIGHRLASPTSTTDTSVNSSQRGNTSKSIKDNSPIAGLAQNASYSSSVCEQSVISTFEDDRRSLNEGFIMSEDKEVDISRIMSEPALAGSHEAGEYVMLGNVLPRETLSDTTILADSRYETPSRGHSRSFSVDSILDNSTKKSSLKRGKPNSLKAGLLQGDQREVQKLRRSFGFDKSDIGFPVPVSVADTSNCDQYIQLNTTMDDLLNSNGGNVSTDGTDMEGVVFPDPDSPGSVSRNKVSTASVANSVTGYECDDERSEAGFSEVGSCTQYFTAAKPCESSSDITCSNTKKTLAEQKQESKDSLLSNTSAPLTPPPPGREREMTRSVSADSGKGSLYEEPMEDGPDVTTDSITSSVLDQKDGSTTGSKTLDTTTTENLSQTQEMFTVSNSSKETLQSDFSKDCSVNDRTVNLDSACLATTTKPLLQTMKSVSSQDLTVEFEPTPTKVSRSKSLLETSLAQRKQNVKPNLQISAETHKLLARAGYIKDNKGHEAEEMDDFPVSGSLQFPVIKQAETINPRRESIIALQKKNAGFVKSNVKQFDQISGTSELVTRHASPLRFPNSTSRRKGMSPLKIPGAFATAEALQEGIALMKDKLHAGVARVPISTQLIKPSNPMSETVSAVNEAKTGMLKRKPSVYYADREAITASFNKYRNALSNMVCERISEERSSEEISEMATNSIQEVEESGHLEFDNSVFDNSDFIKSEIVSMSTPLGKNVRDMSSEEEVENKENSVESGSLDSSFKTGSIPATPVNLDTSMLRTATNKTPVEILKTVKSQRSPVKPLKRLRSPHSPRCRNSRSPKVVRNQSILSTTMSQMDELNNL